MGGKKKGKPAVDHAAPTIKKPKRTDAQKVQCARSMAEAMAQGPEWSAATDVQSATKLWTKSADDLEANAGVISNLRNQLAVAESRQRTLRRGWRATAAQVLSTVNVFCDGSADRVRAFAFDVRTNGPIGAQAPVEGLVMSSGAELGEVEGRWLRGTARHGFVVQRATDPQDPATHSALIPWTKCTFTLRGAPSGSVVHLRVAAVDPTSPSGYGPWSAWTAGTAR